MYSFTVSLPLYIVVGGSAVSTRFCPATANSIGGTMNNVFYIIGVIVVIIVILKLLGLY